VPGVSPTLAATDFNVTRFEFLRSSPVIVCPPRYGKIQPHPLQSAIVADGSLTEG
jgi:hypothetical protein